MPFSLTRSLSPPSRFSFMAGAGAAEEDKRFEKRRRGTPGRVAGFYNAWLSNGCGGR